jgi:hypothetical protein
VLRGDAGGHLVEGPGCGARRRQIFGLSKGFVRYPLLQTSKVATWVIFTIATNKIWFIGTMIIVTGVVDVNGF